MRPEKAVRPIGGGALISVYLALSPSARHQSTLQDHGYGASASHGVPVYVPAFAGTHCAYPRTDDLGNWLHT